MKHFLLLLSGFLFFNFSQAQNLLDFQEPDTVFICFDTSMYGFTFPALQNVDSVKVKYKMPAGINYDGYFTGAVSVNAANPNEPEFFIGSLLAGQSVTVTFSAFGDCSFQDTSKTNTTKVFDVALTNYWSSGTAYFKYDTTNSYNVVKANVIIDKINPDKVPHNINYDPLASQVRSIFIQNTNYGITGNFTLTITVEPEIDNITWRLHSMTPGTFLSSTKLSSNIYKIILSGAHFLSDAGDNDSLFEKDEIIEIIEDFRVISCTQGNTKYLVENGCNGQVCNEGELNAQATANVEVPTPPSQPHLKHTILSYTPTSYCSTTPGSVTFAVVNDGPETFSGAAVASDIVVQVAYQPGISSIGNIELNNVSVGSIPGVRIDTIRHYIGEDTVIRIFLDGVTNDFDGGDDVFDWDGDGRFDDLRKDDTIYVSLDFVMHCDTGLMNDCDGIKEHRYVTVGYIYKDQCPGSVPTNIYPDRGSGIWAWNHSPSSFADGPTDMSHSNEEGAPNPATFTFCARGGLNRTLPNLYSCSADKLMGFIPVPMTTINLNATPWREPIYALASGQSTIYYHTEWPGTDSIAIHPQTTADGDTIFFFIPVDSLEAIHPARNYSGCFDVDLQLLCPDDATTTETNGNPAYDYTHGTEVIQFEMRYVCEDNCPCYERLACGEVEVINHCPGTCPGSQSTTLPPIIIGRTSLGWEKPPAGTYYTEATLPAIKIHPDSTETNTVYECDTVRMFAKGVVWNGMDDLTIRLTYDVPASANILDFISGNFLIDPVDGSTPIPCSINASDIVITTLGSSPNLTYVNDIYLDKTCFNPNNFGNGDTVYFEGFFKVAKNSLLAGWYRSTVRIEHRGIKNGGGLQCDSWAKPMFFLKPSTITPRSEVTITCGTAILGYDIINIGGYRNLQKEDFPNEFRNNIAWDDTVYLTIPAEYDYIENSATFSFYTGTEYMTINIPESSITKTLSTDGDTLHLYFVYDWPLADVAFDPNGTKMNEILKFRVAPNCQIPDGRYDSPFKHGWTTNHYINDPSCNEHENLEHPFTFGLTSYKPYLAIDPLKITDEGVTRKANWTLKICDTSQFANGENVWVAFEQDAGNVGKINFVSASENGVTITDTVRYGDSLFVKLGTIERKGDINSCRYITLTANYRNCVDNMTDRINVYSGWNCPGYPEPNNLDNAICHADTTQWQLDYKPADFEPLVTPFNNDTIDLCDTLRYQITLNSSGKGNMYDVKTWLDLPPGMTLDLNRSQYLYPANAIWTSLSSLTGWPQTMNGGTGWDLSALIFKNYEPSDSAFVGSHKNMPERSVFKMDLYMIPQCGGIYEKVNSIDFNASGVTNCGEAKPFKSTHNFILKPLLALDPDTVDVILSAPTQLDCADTSNNLITVIITNNQSVATNNLWLNVGLPQYTRYNENSGDPDDPAIVCRDKDLLTTPYDSCFIDTTIYSDGSGSARWNIGILNPGEQKQYSFTVTLLKADTGLCFTIPGRVYTSHNVCSENGICCCPIGLQAGYGEDNSRNFSADFEAKQFPDDATADTIACIGQQFCMTLTDTCANTINMKHHWSFGDGTTSTNAQPCKAYTAAGIYTIIHQVGSGPGCFARDTQIVVVDQVVVSVNNDSICGNDTAILKATVTSGIAPFTYLWSNGKITDTIHVNQSGTYTVMVTDDEGCNNTAIGKVVIAGGITVSAGNDTTVCAGSSVILTATASGGASPYTYKWNNNKITDTIHVTQSGTYSVIVTEAGGCTGTDTVVITMGSIDIAITPHDTVICKEDSVTLIASVMGATGTIDYLWSTGAQTQSIKVSAGSYWVEATDSIGCFAYDTATVTINNLDVNAGNDTAICQGSSVTLTATPSGGVGTISYSWSTGATTQSITVTTAGTYIVTATDSAGCSDRDTINVIQNNVSVQISPQDTTICNGGSATLKANPSGGIGTYTYLWSNGKTTQSITESVAGNYSLIVTDAAGCQAFDTATVRVINAPGTALFTTPSTICTRQKVCFEAIDTIGSDLWMIKKIGIFSGIIASGTKDSICYTFKEAGKYTVLHRVSNKCGSKIQTADITVCKSPTVTIKSISTLSCEAVTLCAEGDYSTITWVTPTGIIIGNKCITATRSGRYSARVRSRCGKSGYCESIATVSITVSKVTAYVTVPRTVCKNKAFTITATVNPPGSYTYIWKKKDCAKGTIYPTITTTGPILTDNISGKMCYELTIKNNATGCFAIVKFSVNAKNCFPHEKTDETNMQTYESEMDSTEAETVNEQMPMADFIINNPVQNTLNIEYVPASDEEEIERRVIDFEIYNMFGKRVHNENLICCDNRNFTIDVSHLAQGMYLLKFRLENGQISKKIIITR